MPEMTGIELAVHFRKVQPQCEVLLFSGVAGVWDMLASARAEGYDFELLTKPVHPADLLAKLHGAPVTALGQQS
jgi:DNA-binding NtrC family response regulator